jgi:hypothetical protein
VVVIAELKSLLDGGCRVSKVPAAFASDAEVNIVVVTVTCPDGRARTIKAYREEARELREFIRKVSLQL